ncbi:MAG: ABC transporter ATP-binding protein [Arachidicoccus sp.]|nr:ABC transporter ATP-binding protein [Arachidicoccus sp.]
MIKINDIGKAYNGKIVLNIEQNVEINTAEIIGLVGNNGAGKTTLFRLMLDLIKADKGEILLKDENVATSEKWKTFTAAYLDEGFLIDYLTPEEYFYFVGLLHNKSKADVDEFLKSFEAFFEGSILDSGKYLRDFSKGNRFKVGIAACLLQKPDIIILDEPFANLDPSSQLRLINILKEVNIKDRATILISSHDLNHVTDICSRILLLENGSLIKDTYTNEDTLHELEDYFKV